MYWLTIYIIICLLILVPYPIRGTTTDTGGVIMSKNMERIFFAFLLSFVGSIIARQLGALWWVGLIVGFVTGYIGCDAREFIRAIPVAFRTTCTGTNSWIPTRAGLKRFTRFAFYTFGAGASIAFTFFGAILLVISPPPTEHATTWLQWSAYFGIYVGLTLMFIASSSFKSEDSMQRHVKDMSHIVQLFHPIPFVVRTIWIAIFYVLLVVALVTEKVSEFAWQFTHHLFRIVHSHERVLFGIDVAIGVAIGHYTGNAILGGLAGVAWWILDWHLISLKLMKVQPAR
ncbi:MAG: hypothetical protein UX58_C0011G0009 [Candidatus Wolfebacteria bacterium GW2011_GWB2_46_69]|uniref:Uncharacterized protein n=2 Tax=Candidatus Wolfeibacteriota TaxID=1752735 RepID=A0A0G1WHB8_9BACT|nr:MAG: hypothetical protein UX70_C0001G0294 [Candidatus Wolfebacteria bacterium GW2011_GWB1_47_1]KKU41068.1 MAG: hypothetical protein UX58_C0011G0009 [Candidatus Wolfebacteria bacterium GW2011_GWB2_46_69]KKU53265.1 MAG: hypothetical protein UX76_C0019G0024 [Candidatus Wolfebacteria bacterium GW2011_GWC1_47_103]KKU59114.1 MAG: hypothetical protein UX83_C0008G0064 [Candidatus Wolfebacteria bacterium GW2011_GWE2_47_12]KKU65689.1 MAG: hypothetical protein UX90_C0002G0065 [Candidatus Wolfebacteria 